MVAKTKQRRPRVVGRARKQLAARQRTGRHSAPGKTPQCTSENVHKGGHYFTPGRTPQCTRENITVHQREHHSALERMLVHKGEHHFTPGRTPQCTRLNVSFYTRENTTVHQMERQSTSMFDNTQHTKALHQTTLQTDVQDIVHKETPARQRTPSLPKARL